ncbi:Uncharacterized protein APZ42_024040 [Daphnia magna]|uniref:Uncharacterized protein n=1 Tax=Daphnia magna TaxID=35525 RepID=A0A0P6GZ47_9CRUS|nr:Uncharacterized protein APZ42_024040 [Daphnia magna]
MKCFGNVAKFFRHILPLSPLLCFLQTVSDTSCPPFLIMNFFCLLLLVVPDYFFPPPHRPMRKTVGFSRNSRKYRAMAARPDVVTQQFD